MSNKRKGLILSASGVMAVALAGCGVQSATSSLGAAPKQITIASQDFSEAVIDDYILKDLIEAKTHIHVTIKQTSGASQLMHSMMQQGAIQMYVGYDGTEFQESLHQSYSGKFAGHPKAVTKYVKTQEMKQFGVWVSPSLGYQDTYALAVNQSTAQKYHLTTDSQAAKYFGTWNMATDTTFPYLHHTGLKGFERTYGATFKKVTPMSYNLIYEALAHHDVQAIMAYSTDGRLKKLHEVPLADNKKFFPPYHGIVLIKNSVRKADHLTKVLKPLWGTISTAEQTQMNYEVDVLKESPSTVAHQFLVKKGLI
ncbi:glycine betaine ABC transporter substrate-binding protein [Ferroacidibacillus organovorans]|uniref:ABC-type glycine betaine transport system substrate-binding domain-containing protein n=1 Tax=Ferroacidibacillus organovorans TaxID=1765683 RepID=A0A1V4ERP9_9BACL|nr:glycine betaine ABC transporter substrate-binding protein [Ferroacidibacillus organovorans]OPG15597.1 hypothetical protein B2M26_11075 [Ferroacidibacillus organovorans]